ncbi:MAG TPA: hypothetical protein VMD30_14555 [Tepidisphaeraceae bacterium]|nr:hypothetical protein [Tepidisphaeraceae bacterium]
MEPIVGVSSAKETWTYISLTVIDGPRQLKPAEISADFIRFTDPPRLVSKHVEIVIANGDKEQRHRARVLPHDAEDRQIPIEVI